MTTIPTITQLYQAILADLGTAYGDTVPTFGKNWLRAQAMAQAARIKLYYLVLGNLQKNLAADTADPEAVGGTLERYGRIKIGRNPFPATSAQYVCQVTGTLGAVINASQTFKTNDDSANPGMLFVLDVGHTMAATTDYITLRALAPGLDSQQSIGDGMTATSPMINVNAQAIVFSVAVQPLAAEDTETYRAVVLQAYRDEPQGGAATDYRLWASDAQGVAQTYPYAKSGATNEVNLFVEANIADSTDGKGTPSAFILAAVQAVVEFDPDTTKPLNQRGRRPIGVIVHYLPVTIRNVNINIASFVGITTANQALLLTALQEFIATVRPFVAGADVLANKNDVLSQNNIISVILGTLPGSIFGAVTLTVDGTPYTSFQFLGGDIPYLNSVTYS